MTTLSMPGTPMVYLPMTDYCILLEENRALKQQVISLTGNADLLRQQNANQLILIEELRSENAALKNRIGQLEARISSMEETKLTEKLKQAIQDINAIDNLEMNGCAYLNRLHSSRNEEAHYILEDDNVRVKEYKRGQLLSKLQALGPGKASRSLSRFSKTLVRDLIAHLFKRQQVMPEPSEDDKEAAQEWWD